MKVEQILNIFPNRFRNQWEFLRNMKGTLQEIRLRADQVVILTIDNQEYYLGQDRQLQKTPTNAYVVHREEINGIVQHICKYAPYAYENEMRQGYITIEGGHRIGLVGQVIVEDEKIRNLKYIAGLNIRITHEILGVADEILPYLYKDGTLCNTFILSPPCAGKTTMLRDLIRQVSNGNRYGLGMNVSVVDERSEIAGSYLGMAQNNLGVRTDVLDGAPKVDGMMQLIRTMSPKMLAVDEIGSEEDIRAVRSVLQCGCKLVATIHARNIEEFQMKPHFQELIVQEVIERYVVLGNGKTPGELVGVYNRKLCYV
ncbi:MAG: stage III sporulation protein AA [Eubacteriales bacterium]